MNKAIFNYDKNNNLIEFVELNFSGGPSRLHKVKNACYFRYLENYKHHDLSVYDAPVKLWCCIVDGEYWVRPVRTKDFTYPNKKFFMGLKDYLVDVFTVKNEELNRWSSLTKEQK